MTWTKFNFNDRATWPHNIGGNAKACFFYERRRVSCDKSFFIGVPFNLQVNDGVGILKIQVISALSYEAHIREYIENGVDIYWRSLGYPTPPIVGEIE